MLWDRHVDIRLCLGPMQGQLSSREGGGEKERATATKVAPGLADKIPCSVVFHSLDGPVQSEMKSLIYG